VPEPGPISGGTAAIARTWSGGDSSIGIPWVWVGSFPSLKARQLLAVLKRSPLSYRVVRQSGSHRRLESPAYPPLTFALHDKATIPAGLVRKVLVREVGLAEDEARKLL
jgi:predicted RNA binding protein YcfA (HicA-like mRNA interferase family)